LKDALTSGHVAGAALDVFEVEPAQTNILFGIANVVCTPHLGASTTEAQVNVAIQIAEQMSDFLLHGAVSNAVNMPSITAEEAPRLKPFMNLATQMGALAGQILEGAILEAQIEYIGRTTKLNTRALNISLMATLLQGISDQINMVNAMDIAKSKGIIFSETKTENNENLPSGIKLSVKTEAGQHSVLGTLFAGRDPRIVEIDGVPIEAALTPNMLYIRNNDQPGLIGAVGTILGKAQQNIADFRLGRVKVGGEAVALLSLDTALPDPMLTQIQSLPQVRSVKRLRFY
jgi:D-3-phosphoglycerate dehydrogenase